jgi:vacuolar-type H+-ATPase subunit I/STV1
MEALENFKKEIEEIEELLTQPPEYIYSKLYNFAKLRILLEDLHLDKKELDEYARKVGKEYVAELELTDFPPDIAEKIKEKMFERLRKSVENMKRIYNEVLQLNDKIEEAVLELEEGRYSPFEMNGVKYNGDIFHSWIHFCVEDKFGKHIDETLALLIYLEIAERLERDGYWVHS